MPDFDPAGGMIALLQLLRNLQLDAVREMDALYEDAIRKVVAQNPGILEEMVDVVCAGDLPDGMPQVYYMMGFRQGSEAQATALRDALTYVLAEVTR